MSSITRVRIRGIYATALTVLLNKKGYIIVDMSKVLREKLEVPAIDAPAHVTVKNLNERPDTLLVFGYPWDKGEKVFNDLVEELKYVTKSQSSLGNNTVVSAKLVEKKGQQCILLLPDNRQVTIRSNECTSINQPYIYITIIHDSPSGKIIAKPEIRLVGDYVILSWPGTNVSFSEHIKDPELKADLLMVAGLAIDLNKYHVHFRSNSKLGNLTEIELELKQLVEKIDKLANRTPSKTEIVVKGEFLGFITLPSVAKQLLDKYRSQARPTILYHHSLKSFGNTESLLVDCAETSARIEGRPSPHNGLSISMFLLERSKKIVIDHIKPDGTILRLGPFNLANIRFRENTLELELTRTFTRRGILDGLNIEKEPGDTSISRIRTGEWFIIHEYYTRDGDLLGIYANINTPIEAGQGRIKYLDLLIDVIKKPNEPAKIIDREELEEIYAKGLITDYLYKKALETAEYLVKRLNADYP